jgi:hypothetical protein
METTGSSNIYRIELLKGTDNYAVWKIKMMDILTDQGLWEYVDPGTAPEDANQKSGWDKKDRTALLTIRLQVADKLLVYVASSKSAKEAWNTLKGLLEAQGPLGIVLARCVTDSFPYHIRSRHLHIPKTHLDHTGQF